MMASSPGTAAAAAAGVALYTTPASMGGRGMREQTTPPVVAAGGSAGGPSPLSTPPQHALEHAWSTPRAVRVRHPAVHTYDDFEQLTSVHVNCTDDLFLASGYSNHVGLYDLRTGRRTHLFRDLHGEHINVLKFSHYSPHVFATSSFDREVKLWDARQRVAGTRPVYSVRSDRGNVMVCFSPNDQFLLTSAVDNEVRQHLAVDGRLHTRFPLPPVGSLHNYTRSYYLCGGDYVVSGSCEESVVRVCCARTGRRLRDVQLEGKGGRSSLYVQSLRGDPFRDFHLSVLVAYSQPNSRSDIIKVNLTASASHRKWQDCDMEAVPLASVGA